MLKWFQTCPDGIGVNPFMVDIKIYLSVFLKKNIRLKRAQVNENVIKLFFENFEREANDVPTGNTFNYDETITC